MEAAKFRRQTGAAPADAPVERHPIVVEGAVVGWVEGPRPAESIAAVLETEAVAAPTIGEIASIGTISRDPVDYHASDLRLISAIASLAAPTFDQAAVHQAALRPSTGKG